MVAVATKLCGAEQNVANRGPQRSLALIGCGLLSCVPKWSFLAPPPSDWLNLKSDVVENTFCLSLPLFLQAPFLQPLFLLPKAPSLLNAASRLRLPAGVSPTSARINSIRPSEGGGAAGNDSTRSTTIQLGAPHHQPPSLLHLLLLLLLLCSSSSLPPTLPSPFPLSPSSFSLFTSDSSSSFSFYPPYSPPILLCLPPSLTLLLLFPLPTPLPPHYLPTPSLHCLLPSCFSTCSPPPPLCPRSLPTSSLPFCFSSSSFNSYSFPSPCSLSTLPLSSSFIFMLLQFLPLPPRSLPIPPLFPFCPSHLLNLVYHFLFVRLPLSRAPTISSFLAFFSSCTSSLFSLIFFLIQLLFFSPFFPSPPPSPLFIILPHSIPPSSFF